MQFIDDSAGKSKLFNANEWASSYGFNGYSMGGLDRYNTISVYIPEYVTDKVRGFYDTQLREHALGDFVNGYQFYLDNIEVLSSYRNYDDLDILMKSDFSSAANSSTGASSLYDYYQHMYDDLGMGTSRTIIDNFRSTFGLRPN
jgi:hypothetical protein